MFNCSASIFLVGVTMKDIMEKENVKSLISPGQKKPKNIKLSDNIPREQRSKEAEKPLYLVRYE
jgi:hypothetical protein